MTIKFFEKIGPWITNITNNVMNFFRPKNEEPQPTQVQIERERKQLINSSLANKDQIWGLYPLGRGHCYMQITPFNNKLFENEPKSNLYVLKKPKSNVMVCLASKKEDSSAPKPSPKAKKLNLEGGKELISLEPINDSAFTSKNLILDGGQALIPLESQAAQNLLRWMRSPITSEVTLPTNWSQYVWRETFISNTGTYTIRFLSDVNEHSSVNLSLAKYYYVHDIILAPNRFKTNSTVLELDSQVNSKTLLIKKFCKFSRQKNALVLCVRTVSLSDDGSSFIDDFVGINIPIHQYLDIGTISIRQDNLTAANVFGAVDDNDLPIFNTTP